MISRRLFPVLNFKILCNGVSIKPNFVCLLRNGNHEKNINNIAILSMKSYSTNGGIKIPSQGIVTDKKPLISEKDRVNIDKWLDMIKYEGIRVPHQISEEQYLELFQTKIEEVRKKYLNYLVKREGAKLNTKVVRERKRVLKAEQQEERMNRPKGHIDYGLWKNAMFTKCNKRLMMDLYHHRLISAMQFGQPLVIDLGFDDHMKGRELTSYAEQLSMCISINRTNDDPFNLMFCNVDFDSKGFNKLKKFMPSVQKHNFPMTITSESYLDLFPKEKIVYLTSDAKETLKTFDHNAVYIIGGIVDLGRTKPYTAAKAKREKIRMQKLPLDYYHKFQGSKSLAIHVIMSILLDAHLDGNWKKAFRAIPKRLLQTATDEHSRWDEKYRPW